jgi:hypothetical protein
MVLKYSEIILTYSLDKYPSNNFTIKLPLIFNILVAVKNAVVAREIDLA